MYSFLSTLSKFHQERQSFPWPLVALYYGKIQIFPLIDGAASIFNILTDWLYLPLPLNWFSSRVIKFSRLNFVLNSNFAAHRWRCNHLQHLDRLDVVALALRQMAKLHPCPPFLLTTNAGKGVPKLRLLWILHICSLLVKSAAYLAQW